ncbi:hypothetical protein CDAR_431381 [Caerostris darwini]|uniref:Uncharacterized protein n=2 Tax=Caerostris darwini TaxID=1538125 RepID=A0AAV4SQG6_9ARAC|nr:hypothetical protein CDAR_431381 [Caerostris darwini]
MDAGLVNAKTIKASAATLKKAEEAVTEAENQCHPLQVQSVDAKGGGTKRVHFASSLLACLDSFGNYTIPDAAIDLVYISQPLEEIKFPI